MYENIYIYIHTYIIIMRHLFRISHISHLTNLQWTVANEKGKKVYTTRIIT